MEFTAFVAVLAMLASIPYYGLFACHLFVHIAPLVALGCVVCWAILAGKQNKSQLELKYSGLIAILLRFAGYCGVVVALIWAFFLLAIARSILRSMW